MQTKYIRQGDFFVGYKTDSHEYIALNLLPENRRPIFVDESDEDFCKWKLNDCREAARAKTLTFSSSVREAISKSRHYLQAARWAVQLASAKDIKAGIATPFDISIIAREARLRARGETVEQLADKVIANSLAFASVGAAVDGIETATLDAIQAYTGSDPAAFDAILANAKATALAEFLDIFTPAYGQAQAQAMAAQFFGG